MELMAAPWMEKLNVLRRKEGVKKAAGLLFYLGLTIEILILIIDKSALMNPLEGRLFQITFGLFFLSFLFTEASFEETLCVIVFAAAGFLVDQLSDRNEILRFVIFIAAMKTVDLKKALKFTLFFSAAGIGLLALLSVTGIFGDLRIIKEYPGGVQKSLFAFGLGNANSFHCMVFVLTILFLYLYAGRIRPFVYLIFLGADLLLAVLTRSKTGTAVMAFAVVLMAAVDFSERKEEKALAEGEAAGQVKDAKASVRKHGEGKEILSGLIGKGCLVLNAFCLGISFWFASAAWKVHAAEWGNESMEKSLIFRIDRILTGRIAALTALDHWDGAIQSWRWLPVKGHEAYFDLGFVRLFYWYGIWVALLILAVFALLLWKLYREKDYKTLVFLTLMSCYTVIEAHFVSVYIARNYALFILGANWARMLPGGITKGPEQYEDTDRQ